MKYLDKLSQFFRNCGSDKLFLTLLPSLCALVSGDNTFRFNVFNGLLMILGITFVHFAIKIFDDFFDWKSGKNEERLAIEQVGIRSYIKKGEYLNTENPKNYFYTAVIFLLLFISILIKLCFLNNDFKILLIAIFIPILGVLNYIPIYRKILSKFGSESITAMLCGPINMLLVFYASSKCISPQIIILCVIFYFLILNICYISSILNYKSDIATDKITLPILLNNTKFKIFFVVFFSLIPYILIYPAITFKLIPQIAYCTFVPLAHSFWHIYLMYMFEISPEKNVKWHNLMGSDKFKLYFEQNNLSWYFVRYNFARNIFITFSLILIFSISNIRLIFI